MKKSYKWVVLITLISSLLLAGCSPDQRAKEDGKTEIVLSGWGGTPTEAKLLSQTLEDFEKIHPDIKVKHDVIADQYMDILKTRLIGGTGPDVFYLDAFEAPALIETGVLEPLDKYVNDEFDVADFEKPMLQAFQQKGKTYGFPKDYSTLSLFYNEKMLKEAGVEVPKTWDELQEAAKKLTKDGVYGFGVTPELARLYFLAESRGGQVMTGNKASFASKEVTDGLQSIFDMRLKEKSAGQPNEVGADSGIEMFGQGKAAMVFEGNWAIPYLRDTFPDVSYGTAEVPIVEGKKRTMAFTVAYVMNKDSEHKEAAWKLIEYLTGKEGMKTWTSKGYALPTRKSVAKELGFESDPLRGSLVKGASYATVWQDGPYLPIAVTNFNNQFLSAYLGEQPLQKALEKAQKQANKEITINE
ncbi:sugar transporter [Bacillus sp. SA1-12]|uniref:ABC transporter substrate-binding protein n=1 Tax=Bacillus sp. SA1-12 TaxID=1455638 RepID=UPI000626433B|nr:ABC transporter substrate-binding protein [Bacillus sp. SA1-12]KKI93161.1 sugar transporter [Bacillus sp. SA1-12]